MLQELQTDELDAEDYALLPTSSTAGEARQVQLVNLLEHQGFSDRAPVPKSSPNLTPAAPRASPIEVEKQVNEDPPSPEIEHIEVVSPNYNGQLWRI